MFTHRHTKRAKRPRGFTLIELLVASLLFVIVMLIATNTLIALVQANRKAQALKSVVDNLNITLDSMQRTISMGQYYYCGNGTYDINVLVDCPSGGTTFKFMPYNSDPSVDLPTVYSYNSTTKRLYRSQNGGVSLPVTAPEVSIDSVQFYLVGSMPGCDPTPCVGDTTQPKVVVVIKGTAPVVGSSVSSTFHIQMTATQRIYDIQS